MISIKSQTTIAYIYFLIAAVFGVFLRALHVFDFDVNYRHIVHGHSHIALLGWVYLCLTTLLYHFFISKNEDLNQKHQRIFIFTQCTLVGMMLTFPFQGYALFSIIFSTLFLFASYWFTWFFVKNSSSTLKKSACYPYIKASLYYLVLSSIGPWALGGIMTILGPGSIWYRLAIYFYLHFQYNGWMLLALIGIFIYIFENKGATLPRKQNKRFFIALNISVLLTLFLSALWTKPIGFVYVLSGAGGLLQLVCFMYALGYIKMKWANLQAAFTSTEIFMFKTVMCVLGLKLIIQFLGAIPYFSNLSATIIELTIAYLHWIFLGLISMSLFLILSVSKLFNITSNAFKFYLLGFILTEGLIIYKGIDVWSGKFSIPDYYNEGLLIASIMLFLSIFYVFQKNISKKSTA
ncbi:hypothetical protein [Tamlana sp. I1]|uniref:hypothetical protein n=1 Tax=Tamlana sp. I1 TaxID=2762061 RepID=UPI00188ED64E|nr:hypothetical protein [Tamlana sp. I1]